jgi:hypothetical protein
MRYVQIVLTDSQAALLATGLPYLTDLNDDPVECEQIKALAQFFSAVASNPLAFPVRTQAMARSIKKRAKRLRAGR